MANRMVIVEWLQCPTPCSWKRFRQNFNLSISRFVFFQTLDDIVSSPRNLVKVAETLSDIDDDLNLLAHVVRPMPTAQWIIASKMKNNRKDLPTLRKWQYLPVSHRRLVIRQQIISMAEPIKGRICVPTLMKNSVADEELKNGVIEKKGAKNFKNLKYVYKLGTSTVLKVI